jgi:hypothetical protein
MDLGSKDFSHIDSSSSIAKLVWQWWIFGQVSALFAVAADVETSMFIADGTRLSAHRLTVGVAAKTLDGWACGGTLLPPPDSG